MIKVAVISDANIEAALAAIGDEKIMRGVVDDVMAGARAYWIQLAGQRLKSSRRDYVQGIQQVDIDGWTASIALVGVLPNLIEQGQSPYDMHDTLLGPDVPVVPVGSGLKGKHARKDGGFYRVIPFRHQGPNTIGQGGGIPMGNPYEGHGAVADARALGRDIYKMAKKLGPSTGMPGQKTSWGDRLPEGLAPKLKPHHTTDIYAGMVKMEKAYEKTTQNTYMTFRVISDGVPEKFHHPGKVAANLANEVQSYVEKVATAAFQNLIGGAFP